MMRHLLFVIILLAFVSVHAQKGDALKITKYIDEIDSALEYGKLDEALKIGQKALKLSVKLHGKEDALTSKVHSKLGLVYYERKEFENSILSWREAIYIYEKSFSSNRMELVESYKHVIFSQFRGNHESEIDDSFAKAFEFMESRFGKDAKENLIFTRDLAYFFARQNEFEKADEFYLKSYAIVVNTFEKEEAKAEREKLTNLRYCSTLEDAQENANRRESRFNENINKLLGYKQNPNTIEVDNNLMKGKAISLPQPTYLVAAKTLGLIGKYPVKVIIDEKGDVIEARSVCHNDVLGRESEKAALLAKFSITFLNGNPIKVTGTIIYNFQ